jgi:squalene-hopene/tetraprenyl-beta-curcumene cyclase
MIMRKIAFITVLLLVGCSAGVLFWTVIRARVTSGNSSASYLRDWDATKAADYLDGREVWWQSWAPAQKEQGTICVSCHTVLPYAMARPALRKAVSETGVSAHEKILIGSVEKRVQNWAQMTPFYSDLAGRGKAAQSRATEAVLNAVILASYDARQGSLRPITKTAFDEAWALQENTGENAGGWKWQDFNLAPWESAESGYQGAALLAVKAENAPDGYAAGSDAVPHLERLREYLQRSYSSQPVMNQLFVLWASAKSPQLLTSGRRKALLTVVQSLQQPDGGWSLSSLDQGNRPDDGEWHWVRRQLKLAPKTPESDGCATGLVVLVLEESGTSRQDPMLRRGLQWLERHQTSDGSWRAESLNAKRNPQTDVGRFMSDAATGYAVMALEESH